MINSKRILAALLAAVMMISVFAATAFAAGSKEDGGSGTSTGTTSEYSWNNTKKTATFVRVKKASRATIKTKKISKKLKNGCVVTKVAKNAFASCKKLRNIKFYSTKALTVAKGAFGKIDTKKVTIYIKKSMKKSQVTKFKANLKKAGFKGKFKRF